MDKLAFSIANWCALTDTSRAMFYKLQKQGLAPEVTHVGTKPLILRESHIDWVERMRAKVHNNPSAGRGEENSGRPPSRPSVPPGHEAGVGMKAGHPEKMAKSQADT